MTDDVITEPTVHLCWNDFAIRGAAQVLRAAHLDAMADDMEAQLKPAVEEPTEWGSVVRARRVGYGSEDTTTLRWQRHNSVGDVWISEPAGDLGIVYHSDWRYLVRPEVLRVGIGEPLAMSAADLSRMSVAAHIAKRASDLASGRISRPDPQEAEALARALPRFCTLRRDCRMADGHNGVCQP